MQLKVSSTLPIQLLIRNLPVFNYRQPAILQSWSLKTTCRTSTRTKPSSSKAWARPYSNILAQLRCQMEPSSRLRRRKQQKIRPTWKSLNSSGYTQCLQEWSLMLVNPKYQSSTPRSWHYPMPGFRLIESLTSILPFCVHRCCAFKLGIRVLNNKLWNSLCPALPCSPATSNTN